MTEPQAPYRARRASRAEKASHPGTQKPATPQKAVLTLSGPIQLDLLDGRRKRRNPHARTSEHVEQVTLMRWAALHERKWPELRLLHAVPNGGARHKAVAAAMKAEGVKPGVPDLDLPVARGGWHGLRIELKAKGGKVSPHQAQWIADLSAEGYCVAVCVGWEAARDVLMEYLGT